MSVFRVLKHCNRLRTFCRPVINNMATFTNSEGVKVQVPVLPDSLAKRHVPGQMYKYQDSLQRLPVMPLQQTLDKYLLSVQPLLTPDEFDRTSKIVKEFGRPGGTGEMLNKKLVERSLTHENWLIDWWNHYAYLAFRDTIIFNVTPAVAYPPQPCNTREEFLLTATKLLIATMKMIQLIISEAIPPDMYHGKPYCMSQYKKGGCRIPGKDVDSVRSNFPPECRHVIIIRKGHFYKLDMFYDTPTGEIALAPPTFIFNQLKWIVEDAKERNPYPVGILTTEHRDKWYKAREKLRKDPVNCDSIDIIESAIYAISLDESHPTIEASENMDYSDAQKTLVASRCLHGNGTKYNTINRWFDVTSHLVVGEDGGCGTVLEHSAMDGVVASAYNIHSMNMMDSERSGYDFFAETSNVKSSSLNPAVCLKWNISSETITDIDNAINAVDKLINNVDFQVFAFCDFGKNFPKSLKISPDGFIQNAIQLAYYKLYDRTTAMYESGSTRWFKYGRTDTIRSTTNESHTFLKTMTDSTATPAEKVSTLMAAINAHTQYTSDAISGRGVDRQLLGLKILANQAGLPTPDIFTDVAYQQSTHFCLSTSQVAVPNHDLFLCFGAVVPDGYGVCYNPQENKTLFSISSFHSCPDTDSLLFATKLKESLKEMKDAILKAGTPNSKL